MWQVSPQSPVVWLLREVHYWACAEASTVLKAVTVVVWRSLGITVFGTYRGVSCIMRKAFDWKRTPELY
jgi:hypothetical protein